MFALIYLVLVGISMYIFRDWFSSLNIGTVIIVLVCLGAIGGILWCVPEAKIIRRNAKANNKSNEK